MGNWIEAVSHLVDDFPRGTLGLLYFASVGALALLVFVAVYAHGEKRTAVNSSEDKRD